MEFNLYELTLWFKDGKQLMRDIRTVEFEKDFDEKQVKLLAEAGLRNACQQQGVKFVRFKARKINV